MAKKEKYKAIIIFVAVLSVLIFVHVAMIVVASVMVFVEKNLFYKGKINTCLEINKHEPNTVSTKCNSFKILQLTDLQYNHYFNMLTSLYQSKKVILKTKPDLIVITGDLTHESEKKHYIRLVRFLDSYGITWAPVLGNYDHTAKTKPTEISDILSSGDLSLYETGPVNNSFGNYFCNIKKNNQTKFSLFFMDSGIDGFEEEHVDWYEKTMNQITALNEGKVVPNFVFFHIPTIETQYAYEAYLKDPTIGDGVAHENISSQTTGVKFFEKAIQLGGTKAFIYGHDHINNLILNWNGIKLCYGLKTGRSSYYRKDMLGGNLYTVNVNGDFDVKRIHI